jgi:hypothetical protein
VGLFNALSTLTVIVGPVIAAAEAASLSTPTPWRPDTYNQPALWAVTIPATPPGPATSTASTGGFASAPSAPGTAAQMLVFDAVLKADTRRELRPTQLPIQTSSSSPVSTITDHAFRVATRITLDIAMSDAQSPYAANMWTSDASKSVSAYKTLAQLQDARTLVTLTTRLETFSNVLVELIAPSDTSKTRHGLRAQVVFTQIYLAGPASTTGASSTATSARSQTTDATPAGVVAVSPPSAPIVALHAISTAAGVRVPGAGNWSSSNVGTQ